jgi:imidazolonepropionase-like amidohydrolase
VSQLAATGYPPDEALRSATSVAADECGLAGVTGRVAPGHEADLLVVDGRPQEDLAALSVPAAVWVRGIRVVPG